jgi:hypothetical protein
MVAKAISITYSECVSVALEACNLHAPYCHLWPVWLFSIFAHCGTNGTVFVKTLLNTNCVIQTNHPPDATAFQFIILTFIYSSTCFGRFPAQHQELNDCSGSLWFYLRIVMSIVLCSWSGWPTEAVWPFARCCNYSYMCSWWWVELPPETCRAVYRYIINCT